MTATARTAGTLVGAGLLISVVTQIVYMIILGGPQPSDPAQGVTHADVVAYFTDRWVEIGTVWTIEIVAFTAIGIGALLALSHRAPAAIAWAALLLSAIFNMIQAGFGLSMFAPSAAAGEEFSAIASMIVDGAFFFYFLAKFLIGIGAIGIGLTLFARAGGLAKLVAGATIFSGLVAMGVNLIALPQARALILWAGATGTLAALFLGFAAFMLTRKADA